MQWRLISDGAHDAATNMGIDEAMLDCRTKPTLRLYTWSPPAVSIGYFQSLHLEVNEDACREKGIDIVRRITGGGAVFHDQELTYSLVVPESAVPKDIIKSYEMICGAVVQGLNLLGVQASFAGINDILVGERKISGSAQTRRNAWVLQHGTLILDVDVEKMFSLLKVPDEKLRGKTISSVKERVTSLKQVIGSVSMEQLQTAMVRGFEAEFLVEFAEGEFYPEERERTMVLTEKFKSRSWSTLR
jgi:lipoate---protein ligase